MMKGIMGMLDLTLDELEGFTDEEVCLIEEMSEMLEDMDSKEIQDFIKMVETMGKAKKKSKFLLMDNSSFYH